MRSLCRSLVSSTACLIVGLGVLASPALGQAPLIATYGGTVGYGTDCLSPNDDGSSAVISLAPAFPNGLHFFSAVHTVAYVNTNGNITFSGSVSTYTPNAFPVANQPMIAPYWGDVDIRYTGGYCQGSAGLTCSICAPCHNPTENGVWWHLETNRMVITWDRVGYYSCHNDLRMSFQLILTAAGCAGSGDFDVEFRYNRCEWESGDASGGSGGFGGTEAQAGFDAGNQTDFVAIAGSMAPGIANLLCTTSNVGQPGIWQYQIRSGSIICPDAGLPCNTGLLGVCAEGRTNCVGTGTECVQDVTPTAEVCDAQDNDCDGQIDEEDQGPLCPGTQVCAGGHCVFHCTEFCGGGLVCDSAISLCVEPGCIGVTCPEGQRCIAGGQCVGACDGVVCPYGEECRAGYCVDMCDNVTCDSCTVCEEGLCVPRCEYEPCQAGETCTADGYCVPDACLNVTCPENTHCESGLCVDDCTGTTCPSGQMCEAGACVPIPPGLDAGPIFVDGGPIPDARVQTDVAVPPADAGDTGPTSVYDCNCRQGAGQSPARSALGLLAFLGLIVVVCRRRSGRAKRR